MDLDPIDNEIYSQEKYRQPVQQGNKRKSESTLNKQHKSTKFKASDTAKDGVVFTLAEDIAEFQGDLKKQGKANLVAKKAEQPKPTAPVVKTVFNDFFAIHE